MAQKDKRYSVPMTLEDYKIITILRLEHGLRNHQVLSAITKVALNNKEELMKEFELIKNNLNSNQSN